MKKNNNHAGFTLLELLIVIAIIAILSVALIIVINPAETLKKSRDANRISDLNTIKTALGIYLTSTTTPNLGGAGIADSAADTVCTNSLTTPRSSTTTVTAGQMVDGAPTNWITVNLNSLTSGSPISNLPLDPLNSGIYGYTYKCNNATKTFEVSATLESAEYAGKMTTDGGNEATRYEVGTNTQL